jgi:cyanophycin synthetase
MKKPKDRVQISKDLYGFQSGFRQYSRKLHIILPRLEDFSVEDAKSFLLDAFDITLDSEYSVRKNRGIRLDPLVETFISMCSRLARQLLQFSSIPSFEEDLLVSSQPTSVGAGKTIISMLIPAQANMSAQIFRQAYELSIQIILEFTKPSYQRKYLSGLTHSTADNFVRYALRTGRGGFSTKSILQEAFKRNVPFLHLGLGHYQLGVGSQSRIFSKSATTEDSAIGAALTQNKWNCNRYLKTAAVPVPVSVLVRDIAHAKETARRIGFPVVIKPADRERGEGVTVDINSLKETERAYALAEEWSKSILVEKRIPGICHRLLIFQDTCVFAFSRHPVSVVGDGESTIRDLVNRVRSLEGKRAKHLKRKTVLLDDEAKRCLHMQGYEGRTILEKGKIAHLRPYQSEIWGGHSEIVTDTVHPANVELARRTARLLSLETAGVDIISDDITKPWYENRAAVNEVNFKPQVGPNTAKAIIDRMFPSADSNIPVWCFVGDRDAFSAALSTQAELIGQGISAFVTSHAQSIDHKNAEIIFKNAAGVFSRSELLLRDSRAESLIVVVQTDELLHKGLPVEAFSEVVLTNNRITCMSSNEYAEPETFERLKELLCTASVRTPR